MEENIKESNNKLLGSIIRDYRKRKNLTLENLAKQMDITQLSIQKYEVGQRTIPFNTLVNFFQILDIPLEKLEIFFKKKEKSKIRETLETLSTNNDKFNRIGYSIDYLEKLGFTFDIVDLMNTEEKEMTVKEDYIENPKIIVVMSPNRKITYHIGIRDFLSFMNLQSKNNLSSFINYLEIYHSDINDTINTEGTEKNQEIKKLSEETKTKNFNSSYILDEIFKILEGKNNK